MENHKNENEVVVRLKELTKDWTMGARIAALNEELHNTKDLETKVELLTFKSMLLEYFSLGKINCNHCSCDNYFN